MSDSRPAVSHPNLGSFDNSYSKLPESFFERVQPSPCPSPSLVQFNETLAGELGLKLEGIDKIALAQIFSGQVIPEGCTPIALAYAGHQFGHFVPQLGDGRAILLGEIINSQGARKDLQLKGSGPTRFSRRGDGRYALGPALREYLVSEAMHALGIPTTRSLALVLTGDTVYRGTQQAGAICTRVASSHLRVGSFEYFAAKGEQDSLKILADYAIHRHFSQALAEKIPYQVFLRDVIAAQAKLIAHWMQVGFIHGVMNTDNCSVAGETLDYGPCAFMDSYDPNKVFSSIDQKGRYAFGNQAEIAHWNLNSFASCLLPLLHQDRDQAVQIAESELNKFSEQFNQHWLKGMMEKIGIFNSTEADLSYLKNFMQLMAKHSSDYTLSFRFLSDALKAHNSTRLLNLFPDNTEVTEWLVSWRTRLLTQSLETDVLAEKMNARNPAFIPRNHRIAEVISAAEHSQDFAPFQNLLEILSKPFQDQPRHSEYMRPPTPEEQVHATFCGT